MTPGEHNIPMPSDKELQRLADQGDEDAQRLRQRVLSSEERALLDAERLAAMRDEAADGETDEAAPPVVASAEGQVIAVDFHCHRHDPQVINWATEVLLSRPIGGGPWELASIEHPDCPECGRRGRPSTGARRTARGFGVDLELGVARSERADANEGYDHLLDDITALVAETGMSIRDVPVIPGSCHVTNVALTDDGSMAVTIAWDRDAEDDDDDAAA